MTTHTLMDKLRPFTGKQLIECIDQIAAIAELMKYSVNVMDPEYNISSINEDYHRLNVRTDKDSLITSFTIG